ncbi:DUF1937 family protein [Roseinatronobacter bogoriensis]|nr:DUF1937 family protein [Rhodobaca bogoriensis]MBB4207262.1 hypothetical protein [Rhodobaca bogoriensis DSM 18756]
MPVAAVMSRVRDLPASPLVHWGATPAHVARFCRGRLAYLASPVTTRAATEAAQGDAGWYILERLALECALDMDALAQAGVSAVSPVAQALSMIRARGRSDILHGPMGLLDRDGWMRWGAPLLRVSSAVVVADRPGWAESRGVAAEVDYALSVNMMVFFAPARPEALG